MAIAARRDSAFTPLEFSFAAPGGNRAKHFSFPGMNEGLVRHEKPLTPAQRTKTTLEEFAAQAFAPAFRA